MYDWEVLLHPPPPWAVMWGISLALYALLKVVSGSASSAAVPVGRQRGYWLAWPGMDAESFLGDSGNGPVRPTGREWAFAFCKLGGGCGLVWGVAPLFATRSELLAGQG